jgi:hypothetical protein
MTKAKMLLTSNLINKETKKRDKYTQNKSKRERERERKRF